MKDYTSLLSDPMRLHTVASNPRFDKIPKIDIANFYLVRIDEVFYDDKTPRKKAMENVLSALRSMEYLNFIFLVIGKPDHAEFYYGIAKDDCYPKDTNLSIAEIGEQVLLSAIRGNYRGSAIHELKNEEKQHALNILKKMQNCAVIEGVPGAVRQEGDKDTEKYQGIDRLIQSMDGDTYAFLVLSKPLSTEDALLLRKKTDEFRDILSPLAKTTRQEGESDGTSDTDGSNSSTSESKGKTITTSTTTVEPIYGSDKKSKQTGTSESTAPKSETTGTSTSKTKSISKSHSTSTEYELAAIHNYLKYLDEVVYPRMDYGMGKGMFLTSMYTFADSEETLLRLSNTVSALFSGDVGNRVPLRAFPLSKDDAARCAAESFHIPRLYTNSSEEDLYAYSLQRFPHSPPNTKNLMQLGNWISTNELGIIAGMPKKEVPGISLREEVDFGLNFSIPEEECKRIPLGYLIQNGAERKNNPVCLDKDILDRHIFIAGVTGSGKTTTCQKILTQVDRPFLVIEPAKTEYRILKEQFPDLLVFTLGRSSVTPLRLNPFALYEGESVSSRVDLILASIKAAFDMDAAIPQIIEAALYDCYQNRGWNIGTGKNTKYSHPFDGSGEAFPTLSDLVDACVENVNKSGFDERLHDEYVGSIKARLQGLTIGEKKFLLDTRASIDFTDLLDKKVVFELEDIRSGPEKSLVMGFILIHLTEAIRKKYRDDGKKINHITLVEEAHRLLTKFTPGDDPSKKHGVEMFADMLAEIRKYGESLIIADQIPNKLTPEVLKNTNTKIIHRLYAADDKESVGNTMMLRDEQKAFLSDLKDGRAILFTKGTPRAIQFQVARDSDTSQVTPEDSAIEESVYRYFCKNYKRGLYPGLQLFDHEPTLEEFKSLRSLRENLEDSYFDQLLYVRITSGGDRVPKQDRPSEEAIAQKGKLEKQLGLDFLVEYYLKVFLPASAFAFNADVSEAKQKQIIGESIKQNYIVDSSVLYVK